MERGHSTARNISREVELEKIDWQGKRIPPERID
jgi:hypothetical protein